MMVGGKGLSYAAGVGCLVKAGLLETDGEGLYRLV